MDNQQNERLNREETEFALDLYGHIEDNNLDHLHESLANLVPAAKERILNIPFNQSLLLNLAVMSCAKRCRPKKTALTK